MLIDFHILPPTTRSWSAESVVGMRGVNTARYVLAILVISHGGYFCGEKCQRAPNSFWILNVRSWAANGCSKSTFRTDVNARVFTIIDLAGFIARCDAAE